MAVPVIKTHEEIYDALKANMQTESPGITDYSQGSVIRALLYVEALAIRLVYIAAEALYINLFPQDADTETLKRYYDEWGLTWDDPTDDVARAVVLGKYQTKSVIGTETWYEDQTKAQFPIVTEAYCYPTYRGWGTIDLLVMHNNNPLLTTEVAEIQAYYDATSNHVLAADVYVRTSSGQAE